MESCLYEGIVRHERFQPVTHRFSYRLFMTYLDLDEVPALLRAGLLSGGRFAAAGLLRRDHFGDPRRPLAECVRERVAEATGVVPTGPVRLLTQLRCLGYYFSPLNLFFCLAADGHTPEAIVAEVQNTPWLERHSYLLWAGNREGDPTHYRHAKSFHVSPFMGLAMEYRWRVPPPGEALSVTIENGADSSPLFRAGLGLRRVPLTRGNQLRLLCCYPLLPARITAAIYFEAFHLWRKRCPYYPHPGHNQVPASGEIALAPSGPACSTGSVAPV